MSATPNRLFATRSYFGPAVSLSEAETHFCSLITESLPELPVVFAPAPATFNQFAIPLEPLANQLHNLGVTAWQATDFEAAMLAFSLALRCRLRLPHPPTREQCQLLAMQLHHLAMAQRELGEFDLALSMLRQAVADMQAIHDPADPEWLDARNNLATLLQDVWQLDEAIPLLAALATDNERYRPGGASDPATLTVLSNLADAYKMAGDYAQAFTLSQQVIEARKQHPQIGPQHPDYLTSLNNFADLLRCQGQLRAAQQTLQQVLTLRHQILGEAHPDTITAKANLACACYELGEWQQALTLERAVFAARRMVGEDHPDTLTAANNLAGTLRELGEFSEAMALAEQVYSARLRQLGETHNDTLTAMINLADLLREAGEPQRAQDLASRAWRIRKQALGETHPDTLAAAGSLAAALHVNGEAESAITLQRTLCQAMQQTDQHWQDPRTLNALNDLASLLMQSEQFAMACELYRQVLAQSQQRHGETWPGSLTTRLNLAQTEYLMGEREAAHATLQTVLDWLADQALLDNQSFGRAARAAALLYMISDAPEVDAFLSHMSRAMVSTMELLNLESAQRALPDFRQLHEIWLRHCLAHAVPHIPLALAPLHGIEASRAAILALERQRAGGQLPADSQEALLLDARAQLADIRLHLQYVNAQLEALVFEAGEAGLEYEAGRQLLASQQQWRTDEANALARYRQARTILIERGMQASDPADSPFNRIPSLTLAQIQAHLRADQAAIFLIHLQDGYSVACVVKSASVSLVPLPQMAQLLAADLAWHSAARNGVRRILTQEAAAAAAPTSLTMLEEAGFICFWQALGERLTESDQLLIICSPALRHLCLELGNPHWPCAWFTDISGFVRHLQQVAANPASQTSLLPIRQDMGYDCAWQSGAPLPFVLAEMHLMQTIFAAGQGVTGAEFAERLADGNHAAALHLACHGITVGQGAGEHAVLLLDSAGGRVLDPAMIHALPGRIDEWFCATCVGALVSQHSGTDAIGIISALQNRGVACVIACYTAVSDFFMPLLAAFYWLARQQGHLPSQALGIAKRQLTSGNWPDSLLLAIFDAYRHATMVALECAQWHSPDQDCARAIAHNLRNCPLPIELAGQVVPLQASTDDYRRFSANWCEAITQREQFATLLAGHLLASRNSLAPTQQQQVRQLCAFTVCFGALGW